jgi:hypothetical protein
MPSRCLEEAWSRRYNLAPALSCDFLHGTKPANAINIGGFEMMMTRRTIIQTGTAYAIALALPAKAKTLPGIHVLKDPGCPCCNAWIGHLRDNGFPVSFEERSVEALELYKRERAIPASLSSCHTGLVDGYVVEGHVPAADIHRLLDERPEAVGLSVPGMPFGSPGMGPETERQAYDVILIGKNGTATVFSHYPGA